jgi:O-antigen ligase
MALAIPIGAYAMLSVSMLTVGGLLIGSVSFITYRYLCKWGKNQEGPLFLLLLISIGVYGAGFLVEYTLVKMGKTSNFFELLVDAAESRNIAARMEIWQFYGDEITSSPSELALGHKRPPDRNLYPSAHNYYLDFVYNFGLLALVPILWLIAFTLWKSGLHWKRIVADPEFFVLVGTVLFLILVDNSLKVSLRQPYPGIVTFFLWGVLLARLGGLGGTAGTYGTEGSAKGHGEVSEQTSLVE